MSNAVGRTTILCIDDYLPAVTVRKLMLEQVGFKVIVASTGEQGLEIVRNTPVDLVLSDHFLQGKTGGEIAREMKALRPEMPIVLLSGAVERPPDTEYADAWVTKLDGREYLLQTIAGLLDKRLVHAS